MKSLRSFGCGVPRFRENFLKVASFSRWNFPLFCTYLDFLQHLFVVAALDCTQKQSIVVGDLTFFFKVQGLAMTSEAAAMLDHTFLVCIGTTFLLSANGPISLSLFNFWTLLMVIIIGNGRIFLFPKFAFYLHCIVYKDMEMKNFIARNLNETWLEWK